MVCLPFILEIYWTLIKRGKLKPEKRNAQRDRIPLELPIGTSGNPFSYFPAEVWIRGNKAKNYSTLI